MYIKFNIHLLICLISDLIVKIIIQVILRDNF